MSWKTALAAGRVRVHTPSRTEFEGLRELIARDLSDANIPKLSADRKFATAYNAALQLGKMAVACAGYRVATGPGHHQSTFEFAALALGMAATPYTDYFEICRRKRNLVDYDAANVASETEAAELLRRVEEFAAHVEAWITQRHPHLKA